MPIQRYNVPDKNHEGEFITRYWDPSHTPVLDEQGVYSGETDHLIPWQTDHLKGWRTVVSNAIES